MLTVGRERIGTFASAIDAVAHLECLINGAAARSLRHHVLLHAGAVGAPATAVFPGASGKGKSTLVAALCLSGFSYFSDELAVVDADSVCLLPFLKPICLKDGGWRTLGARFAMPRPALRAMRHDGESVRYFVPSGPCGPEAGSRVRYVVVPARQTGAPATLTPISRPTALLELARCSLNLPRHGRRGIEALARLVEGAECYTLTYDDLREAVAVISELVGPPAGLMARRHPVASSLDER